MAVQPQIRRHPPTTLRVGFEHPTSGQRAEATAWDASLGGMFLETSAPFAEGALVALEITTADAKVSVDARVLWTRATSEGDDRPAGMSVRFIDLPDDVSVALNRALLGGMQERTILGVGGATQERTQIGIAPAPPPAAGAPPPPPAPAAGAPPPAPPPPKDAPRETQLGVAPQANTPAGIKPKLVIADASLPGTPVDVPAAPPPAPAPKPAAAAEPAPARAPDPPSAPKKEDEPRSGARSMAPSAPPRPPMQGGAFGRVVAVLLFGGAAAGVYLYRDPLAQMIAGPQPTTTATPPPLPTPNETGVAAPSATPAITEEDASGTVALGTGIDSGQVSDAATDAASSAHDAGHGSRDAGHDGGGKHDAGTHGRPDAGRPKHP
jgi:uncharacterized protein (TIGR02266 family)